MPNERHACGPQEVAWLSTFVLTCITLVMAILCFRRGEHLRTWASQSWTANKCNVLRTGISYAGNCDMDLRTPYHYQDCKLRLSNYEKHCFGLAGESYRRMSRLRRLNNRSAQACSDSFLVWAYVEPQEYYLSPQIARQAELLGFKKHEHLCGYTFGTPQVSITQVLAEAIDLVDRFNSSALLNCWVLQIARPGQWLHRKEPACRVVALEDPSGWTESASEGQAGNSQGPLWFPCLFLICGMSAIMSAFALCWCIRDDVTAWSALSYGDSSVAHGSQAGAGSVTHQLQALHARRNALRDRMDFFQRSILDEYRVVVSAREQHSARAWSN